MKIKDRLLAQAGETENLMRDTGNYSTSFIGQLDKINNNATDRIRNARTQKARDEILLQRRKDVAALLKRYDPEGQYKRACNPLLRKMAYGTARIDDSYKLARSRRTGVSTAAGSTRPRDSRRAAQKKKEKGDGSGGDDGPCPDPYVISNIIKTSLGCSRARRIRKVGTSPCSNHFTCPMAVLSRNLNRIVFLADSGLFHIHKTENAPRRFASARLFPAGSSRRPK